MKSGLGKQLRDDKLMSAMTKAKDKKTNQDCMSSLPYQWANEILLSSLQTVHFETLPTFGNCYKLVLHLKKVHWLWTPCRNIKGFGQMRFIKRFWNNPFNIGVYGKYHLFCFTQESYLSKDLGEIYIYEKICKVMEIRPMLRHLGIQ